MSEQIKFGFFEKGESAVINGDSINVLRHFPNETIQCVITSPPYWGLRDYNIDGQIGLELTIDKYIRKLIDIFTQIRRILKKKGTLWVIIGDGYTSGNRKYRAFDKKYPARKMKRRPDTPIGLKQKDLLGIPWKLAFALQNSGWYLRADIIWHKPNSMPESVKDRPFRSHEYIFLLSKSKKYFFDSDALIGKDGKRLRSIWEISKNGFKGNHFATFPKELIIPCISSSTKEGDWVMDPFFGTGTIGEVSNELKRLYLGIELNPEYINLALARINRKTQIIKF